ncbi:MAG: UDP-N-acetylmuramoyl-tripeptide--D-alanyl-D-alanine ligase [Candidatus Omnitrophota bacterium]
MFSLKELIGATQGQTNSRQLLKRFCGVSIDTRKIREKEVYITICGKKFDGHNFIEEAIKKGAGAVIYSDSSKIKVFHKNVIYVKVGDTVKALGDIARSHRRKFKIPVIAITGSSGKTTTKEMISWVLGAEYHVCKNEGTKNNLIGVPLTLLGVHSKHDLCVIELGTNRFGEIKRLAEICEPTFGVITNIGPAHLEFLRNLKGVYQEKIELIRELKPPGIVLLNKTDLILSKLSRIKNQPIFFFGINRECDFKATDIMYDGHNSISFLFNGHPFKINHCALHNVSNALAAIACGLMFGLDMDTIRQRLEMFDHPEMRLKEIVLKQCIIYDDSYNSNPQSLKQAIDVLCRRTARGRKILVMGDMLELGAQSEEFHEYFGRYVSKKPIDIFVTLGDFSRLAMEHACKNGMSFSCVHHFSDCSSAAAFLHKNIRQGDVLLIKGSRSLQMEKIVNLLREACA